jgi:hypothetical protein
MPFASSRHLVAPEDACERCLSGENSANQDGREVQRQSGQLCPQTQRETSDLGKWIKDSVIIAEHAPPVLAIKHHRSNERVPRLPESKGSNEGGDWAEPHCI